MFSAACTLTGVEHVRNAFCLCMCMSVVDVLFIASHTSKGTGLGAQVSPPTVLEK